MMHTDTSMTPAQKEMILDAIGPFYKQELLSRLTGPQLHELWLLSCERANPYADLDTSITKMYREELCIDGLGDIRD